ncbi:MAG: DUF1501 domain-containing protein [Acidobacteriota bacterium]
MLTRRKFVALGASAIATAGYGAPMAFARAATHRRLVFIIQRGAADGLATLAPVGDPAFLSQRGALARDFASAPKLDSMFALHPSLTGMRRLYDAKQALFVHAVASPYRERSHFDGQNVLETGGGSVNALKDGWLNRLLSLLPPEDKGIALAATVPMALRGPVPVASYAPSTLPNASQELLTRVSDVYDADPQLHAVWAEAIATRMLTSDFAAGDGKNAASTGALAAKLLSAEDGARIAMIETSGWDTHAGQRGRLLAQLKALDVLLASLQQGLGALWSDTLVIVATEFGRTVKVNGTQGTDHGTGSMAMLFGGTVNGGRVVADWPGLSDAALYEGRDLKPTAGLDTVITSAVAPHFDLTLQRAAAKLFPDVRSSGPISNLVRG